MSGADSWWGKQFERIADKIAERSLAWALGALATSGLAVWAKREWSSHAPKLLAAALAASSWIVLVVVSILLALAGFRARVLNRKLAELKLTAADAEQRGRRALEAELRAQWNDEVAMEAFGLDATDAWCFVHEIESTWSLHMNVRAWSAIPYPATVTLVGVTFALDDGRKELASVNPHLAWNPLRLGLNDEVRLTAELTSKAAELIRKSTTTECAALTAFVRVSLSFDGGPPTNPDKRRLRLDHPLRVQR
jgi:hypothetical protein